MDSKLISVQALALEFSIVMAYGKMFHSVTTRLLTDLNVGEKLRCGVLVCTYTTFEHPKS